MAERRKRPPVTYRPFVPPKITKDTATFPDGWTVTRMIAKHGPIGAAERGHSVTQFEIREPSGRLYDMTSRVDIEGEEDDD